MRSFPRGAGDIACTRLRWNSATNGSSGHPRMRSTSGFYAWLTAMRCGPSPREVEEACRLNAITRHLRRDRGRSTASESNGLMRMNGIVRMRNCRSVRTTIPAENTPLIPGLRPPRL